jgi:hypothetical protein
MHRSETDMATRVLINGRVLLVEDQRVIGAPCDLCGTLTRNRVRAFAWRCESHRDFECSCCKALREETAA